MAEPTAKAVKITSLKEKLPAETKKPAVKTPIVKIKTMDELEQWIEKMILLKTPEYKIKEIIPKVTDFSESEISMALQRVKATKLLQERYSINEKTLSELKKFILKEIKKGAAPEQIIADLAQEGWDIKILRPYVIAHYQ